MNVYITNYLCLLVGLVLGGLWTAVFLGAIVVGKFTCDTSDPGKDVYRLDIDRISLNDLERRHYVLLKVVRENNNALNGGEEE